MTAGRVSNPVRVLPLLVALVLACAVTLVASGAPSAPTSGRIAVGFLHACVITRQGGVACWGANVDGQLGNPTRPRLLTHSTTPVDVVGLRGVSMITAGDSGSCALTRAGAVKCWGGELHGRTDNLGRTIVVRAPVDVVGLTSGIKMIAGGSHHNCALTRAGGAKCWGLNSNGQLGVPAGNTGTRLVAVTGATSGVSAITAGGYHTCALTSRGGVKCWGANESGQLGDASRKRSTTPVDVVGISTGAVAVGAGANDTCALMRAGGVKCWGSNRFGQLGNGSTRASTTPVDVRFTPARRTTSSASTDINRHGVERVSP